VQKADSTQQVTGSNIIITLRLSRILWIQMLHRWLTSPSSARECSCNKRGGCCQV